MICALIDVDTMRRTIADIPCYFVIGSLHYYILGVKTGLYTLVL